MKKIILIFGGTLLILLLIGYIAIYIWIDTGVKNNIKTAKDKYSGKAEDALIAYPLALLFISIYLIRHSLPVRSCAVTLVGFSVISIVLFAADWWWRSRVVPNGVQIAVSWVNRDRRKHRPGLNAVAGVRVSHEAIGWKTLWINGRK